MEGKRDRRVTNIQLLIGVVTAAIGTAFLAEEYVLNHSPPDLAWYLSRTAVIFIVPTLLFACASVLIREKTFWSNPVSDLAANVLSVIVVVPLIALLSLSGYALLSLSNTGIPVSILLLASVYCLISALFGYLLHSRIAINAVLAYGISTMLSLYVMFFFAWVAIVWLGN